MAQKTISSRNIKGIIIQHAIHGDGTTLIARSFKIAKSTVHAYIKLHDNSDLVHADILNLSANNIAASIRPQKNIYENARYALLRDRLLQYHQRLENENTNLKTLWQEYKQNEPSGLKYSRFVDHYHMWRKENEFSKVHFNKRQIRNNSKVDEITLRKWRLSNNRGKWERAVALLDLHKGCSITKISKKIERSCKTINKWHAVYIDKGIEYLDLRRTRRVPEQINDNIRFKKERIIKLIHESPSLHDVNRTSWSLQTLAQAYDKIYDETISKTSISEYVRSEGYTFKKARTVLTSPDPEYRNKHNTPFVELAPLPSSAQFLNVIESVFSGMAKAVIHNSDYQSIDECKLAINRYFSERNQAFLENPKRAGKKIWGEEVVKAVFKDSNNCKDHKYR